MTMRLMSFASVLFVVLLGCTGKPEELKPDQYASYIVSDESGLVKQKQVNNVKIRVRFLPSEYLAYREFIGGQNEVPFDSIWDAYRCGLSFQVVLEADKADSRYGSLLYYDAASPEEISARIRFLSFNIQEFIELKHDGLSFEPSLSHFEGFDQLGNKMSFQCSFIIKEFQCGSPLPAFHDLTLVYDDPFLDLGTNQFEFSRVSLTEIPRIIR